MSREADEGMKKWQGTGQHRTEQFSGIHFRLAAPTVSPCAFFATVPFPFPFHFSLTSGGTACCPPIWVSYSHTRTANTLR